MSVSNNGFFLQLSRDLRVAMRRFSELMQPLLFFVIVVSLFPLALSPRPELLAEIGPGVIWVAALLATLLSMEGVFKTDFEDGGLEQLALSPHPLPLTLLARATAHWLLAGLPLVLLAPLIAGMFFLPLSALPTLVAGLLLGTPLLVLLGTVGAALTVSLRRGGVLLSLLVLPLMVPVLIFGARATDMAVQGETTTGPLYLLASLLVLGISLVPFATAAAIRISLD